MIIACVCEGQLYLMADNQTLVCGNCRKTYPGAEVEKVLKLLAVAGYRPSDQEHQTAPSESEVRNALRLAGKKAAHLKLRLLDEKPMESPRRVPIHAAETIVPAPPVGWGWTSTNTTGNTVVQQVVIRTPHGTYIYRVG